MDLHFADWHGTVRGTSVRVAYLRRPAAGVPLVCLHGFGSTKEDYADLALHPAFAGRDLVMLDAPGCGASYVADPEAISIPFLVDVALAVCDALELAQFHLSGHSMGGLTALLLAHHHPERLLSFIDIEGNVAPEDCFLSRQIVDYPASNEEEFLDGFIARLKTSKEYSSVLYSIAVPSKVRSSSVKPIFSSMVELSDGQPLMDHMLGLPCPRVFIYGEQNRHLSYLDTLQSAGVDVVEIPWAGHFPMYSNPPALWSAMADFLNRAEAQR
ncbi:MAG: alpha/beta hydrolase [Pseudomonadota bacterium]